MKAIVQERFGPPEVLRLVDTDLPKVGAGDVLVRVHAAALNPYDWHIVRGDPPVAADGRCGADQAEGPGGRGRRGRTGGGGRRERVRCGPATRCSASARARSPSTRGRRRTRWCPCR
jgi:hypothetical protein